MAKKEISKMLTDTELEFISVLWRIGEGTVNDVMAGLPPDRKPAYTSVSTILRILEQKGVLAVRKEGRGHMYIPKIAKADYEAKAINHVVTKIFDGTPVSLVRQLLGSVKMSADELAELKELLDGVEKRK